MKIAFVGGRGVPARYGGFETATEEIGARLAERGHEVVVYCRRPEGEEPLGAYRGMRLVHVPALRKKSFETLSHTFLSLSHLFFRPPDALIVLNPANAPLCIAPRLRGTPFALHVDGLDWERGRWPAWGRRYIRFGAWFATKIAPAIIADSRGIQQYYRNHWGRETHYASYGADPVFPPAPRLVEEMGLKPRRYFLVVARLEPENHTDLIIRAYNKLQTDMPLVIVGDTNYESAYTRSLAELADGDRVRLVGGIYDRERLNALLCHCYAYAHGHAVGGTNPVLLNAMACGACILYLDVNFNVEVAGEAGISFPLDVDGAAAAFQAAIDDPARAEKLRDQARERVAEAYTWEGATDAYEGLCFSLAKQYNRSLT